MPDLFINILSRLIGRGFEEANAGAATMSAKMQTINRISQATGLSFYELDRSMRSLGLSVGEMGEITYDSFTTGQQTTMEMNTAIEKVKETTRGFRMELLGLMFGFAMIQRATLGFLRTSIAAYEKAFVNTSHLAKATGKLRAAWEFFKFSLIDAMAKSKLFQWLVDALFTALNWLNEFMALHPKIKEFLPLVLIFVGVASAILATLFALGLMYASAKMFLGLGAKASLFGMIFKGIGAIIAAVLAPKFLILAAIVAALLILWITNFGGFRDFMISIFSAIWTFIKDVFVSLWGIISSIFMIIVAMIEGDWDKVWAYTQKFLAHLGKLFLAFVKLLFSIFGALFKFWVRFNVQMGLTFYNAMSLAFRTVSGLFASFISLIASGWRTLMGWMIDRINALIRPIRGLLGRVGIRVPLISREAVMGSIDAVESFARSTLDRFDRVTRAGSTLIEAFGTEAGKTIDGVLNSVIKSIDKETKGWIDGAERATSAYRRVKEAQEEVARPALPALPGLPAVAGGGAGGQVTNVDIGSMNIKVESPAANAEQVGNLVFDRMSEELRRRIYARGF